MLRRNRRGCKLNSCRVHQILKVGEYANLNVEVLSPKSLKKDNVDQYNDIATLNAAFSELLMHADWGMSDDVFVLSQQNKLNEIRKKYNTDFFSYNGQLIFKKHKRHKALVLIGSILYTIALPLGVKYAFTPDYESYYYNMVLDLKNGKFVTASFDLYNVKPTYGRTCSILYNDMSILKSSVK